MTTLESVPADIEAEMVLITAICELPEAADSLLGTLKPSSFHDEQIRGAWSIAQAMWRDGKEVNRITLAAQPQAPSHSTFAEWSMRTPTLEGYEFYVEIVKQQAARRWGMSLAAAMGHAFLDPARSPMEVASEYLDALQRGEQAGAEQIRDMASILDALSPELTAWMEDPTRLKGIPTGWPELDGMLSGLVEGCMTALHADTGVGKSFVCSNLSLTAAAQLTPVLYVSTEMTDAQSAWRMLMLESGLNDQRIRRRQMVAAHERGQILEAETRLRAMPIAFAGMPTLAQLRSHIRRFATLNVRAGQTGLVIVDHMGDVRIPGYKGSRAEEIEETMRGLKELVQRLPVHVLYVVHANRDGAKNGLSLNSMLGGGEYARRADNALILEPVRREGGEWVTISRQEAAQDRVSGELMLRCLVLKARHGYESTTMLRQNWKLGGAITEVEA